MLPPVPIWCAKTPGAISRYTIQVATVTGNYAGVMGKIARSAVVANNRLKLGAGDRIFAGVVL
jgi:hypothetical protein